MGTRLGTSHISLSFVGHLNVSTSFKPLQLRSALMLMSDPSLDPEYDVAAAEQVV